MGGRGMGALMFPHSDAPQPWLNKRCANEPVIPRAAAPPPPPRDGLPDTPHPLPATARLLLRPDSEIRHRQRRGSREGPDNRQ